jgi:hypothetical protein
MPAMPSRNHFIAIMQLRDDSTWLGSKPVKTSAKAVVGNRIIADELPSA